MVSFRYLQSVGNNKHMLLGGRGGDEAVHFHEPDGFSSVGVALSLYSTVWRFYHPINYNVPFSILPHLCPVTDGERSASTPPLRPIIHLLISLSFREKVFSLDFSLPPSARCGSLSLSPLSLALPYLCLSFSASLSLSFLFLSTTFPEHLLSNLSSVVPTAVICLSADWRRDRRLALDWEDLAHQSENPAWREL